MRSGNPMLKASTFEGPFEANAEAMTLQGTVHKTLLLLVLVLAGASAVWSRALQEPGNPAVMTAALAGAIGGFVLALLTTFKRSWSPFTAPVYALCEGVLLGAVSALAERRLPGVPLQAVALTFGVCLALLLAYRSGLVRATENFKLGVVAATGGIAFFYLAAMVMRMFGMQLGFMTQGTPLGIGISLVVVVIAALNLVLDFDFIEQGVASRAPKYMEWYGAFGLVVTLVWLYLELLRLLSKLQRRD